MVNDSIIPNSKIKKGEININNIEKFINAAMQYKGNSYSQANRMDTRKGKNGHSDCSSLIQKALNDIGKNTRKNVSVTTHRMGIEGDSRFIRIDKSQLKRGDILWGGNYIGSKWEGHVAIYLGDGKTLEARVKEGVDFNKNRPYFTRVYRIKSLIEPVVNANPDKIIENVPIEILGKIAPTKGYIVKGVTFVDLDKKAVKVRDFFEMLGFTVSWDGTKVIIK